MKSNVTVAIPVYNDEKYLREAIDSILHQTYKDFILLIINDGSTDSSQDIIASYTDKRIKLINHPCNMGRSAARNTALEAADTEYLAWMDADDISLPDRLQKQIAFLDSHPKISVCGSRVRYFHEMQGSSRHPATSSGILATTLFHPAIANPSAVMRLSSIRQKNISYDALFKRAEDFSFWADCFLIHSLNGFVVPDILLKYRVFSRPTNPEWHLKVIQNKVLPAIHMTCTVEETEIHAGLVVENRTSLIQKYGLESIFNWLERLDDHCQQQKVTFSPIVTSLIHAYAERVVAAAPNPLQALQLYRKYPLSKKHAFSHMYLRTAARWGYGLFKKG